MASEIRAHVEAELGPVARVQRGRGTRIVHVDLLFVEPSDERPCISIVTCGMSSRAMRTPREAREWRRCELMVNLPEDWPLDAQALGDERWSWPLRWLESLACFPHENHTWLGLGHTLPNDEPPQPLSEDTEQCAVLLSPPYIAGPRFARLDSGREHVHFYGVMPLYREELELAASAGAALLDERFAAAEIVDLIDLERANVALA